jgi:methyl-accepting chemotaxis protein
MTWFRGLKIGTKLLAVYISAVLLTAIFSWMGNTILAISSALLSSVVAVLTSSSISKRVKKIADFAEKAAAGDMDQEIDLDTKDELGELASSLRKFYTNYRELASIADQISKGNLAIEVKEYGDSDAFSKSMKRCIKNMQLLEQEIARLIDAAASGRLAERGNSDLFQGSYATVMKNVNSMLDAVVKPVGRALRILNQVANRDLTARLAGNYRGDHATFQKVLNSTIQTLDEALEHVSLAAEQVSSASTNISEGSQILSQSSSEQASSIEEVSSSLHEVASMSRQNSENAKEARELSKSAELAVEAGVQSMNRLSEAIDRIKASSDSTAKIIKTIDEIAFQTNLLALNAAVEAARAGDAGKGFAVVAEEVRNLAMRSAEAAKNTANLIEGSVRNSESGVILNQEAIRNLNEISGQVKKVGAVMADIAAASEQQTQGIDQVNVIINQMNLVTQQIAANSEESASGAEELSGQAEELKGMVRTFHLSKALASPLISSEMLSRKMPKLHTPISQGLSDKTKAGPLSQEAMRNRNPAASQAAALIPFDEKDQLELNEF